MRDVLDYVPIAGTVILTGGIAWVGVSTWIGNKRKIASALAGAGSFSPLTDRSTCCNAEMRPLGWTEDGWVATCRACGAWQYLGDDHDHPPIGFNEDGSPREGWNAAPYGFYASGGMISHNFSGVRPLDEFRNSRRTLPNSRPVASGPAPSLPTEPAHPIPVAEEINRDIPIVDRVWPIGQPIYEIDDEKGYSFRDEAVIAAARKVIFEPEVTSNCTCHPDDRPPVCQHRYAASECQAAYRDTSAGLVTRAELLEAIEDEGEPLPMPPAPNMGGEGHPEYKGPHYDSVLGEESRFVPYEVLRDPLPDAAVHFAGDGDAVAGPLAVEHEGDHHGGTDTRREEGKP